MSCSECEVLKRELEEGKAQVARYETKIRDTVNAYKMLESQKQSLEVALSVLSVEAGSPEDESNGKAGKVQSSSSDGKQEPGQRESLRQAISTLTLVNKRKELEFKRDRRVLMEEKDELQRKCDQLEQQLKEQKQQSKSQNLRRLREQLAQIQVVQERSMAEHGMVLAEMQQQYGKEKRNSENLDKQITEMSQRLATKDELLKRMDMQLKAMPKLEQEMEALRKKTEMTPTARIIRDELANVKASSDQEVYTLRTRFALQSAQLRERDARIEQLEQRVQEMSEQCVQAEKIRIELEQNWERERKEESAKKAEEEEKRRSKEEKKKENMNLNVEMEQFNLLEGIEQFRVLYQQLRTKQPHFDAISFLNIELPQPNNNLVFSPNGEDDQLTNPTQSSTPLNVSSRNSSSICLAASNDRPICDSCMASHRELEYFKSFIGHLQRKLGALEESHEKTKREHQNSSEMLRERIIELEGSQNRQYAQLTVEAKQRVAELEEELQKQRNRMLEIVAEKDREIELTKNSLAQFYARNYGGSVFEEEEQNEGNNSSQNLPMDPAQPNKRGDSLPDKSQTLHFKLQSMMGKVDEKHHRDRIGTTEIKSMRRKGSISSMDNRRRSMDAADLLEGNSPHVQQQSTDFSTSFQSTTSLASRRTISRTNTLQFVHQFSGEGTMLAGAAARNIFYEQELCKREHEISDLRNVIRLLELKVRDIEQAMLLKDVQYLQIIETLKEEIRVLEGRLNLASSQTNLAYLRNIFLQFLNQSSANGRNHILKAIGAVLQLTSAEMQRVDRWNH